MGKNDKFVNIDQSPDTRNNWRLATDELGERSRAMAKMISYAAAKEAFDMLLEEIPSGADYEELRKSLKLVEVSGPKKGREAAYAIHVPVKGRRIKSIDVSKTVISVQAKKGRDRPAEDILLLESSGPWTADTIPFWPKDSEAVVVQKKSTRKETDRVAKEQKKKIPGLLKQFNELGRYIKPYKPGDPGRIKRNAKAVPDLAMLALNLEFGGRGTKTKPVFRKTLMSIRGSISGLAERFSEIKDAMTDPNSKVYKSWPKRMSKIGSGQATKFIGFQKRLGF